MSYKCYTSVDVTYVCTTRIHNLIRVSESHELLDFKHTKHMGTFKLYILYSLLFKIKSN